MSATVSHPSIRVHSIRPAGFSAKAYQDNFGDWHEPSAFVTALKAENDRVQRCRDIAKEMGLPSLGNFPGEYAMRQVEAAYAERTSSRPAEPFINSLHRDCNAALDRGESIREAYRAVGIDIAAEAASATMEEMPVEVQAKYGGWVDARNAEIDADLDASAASGMTQVEELCV